MYSTHELPYLLKEKVENELEMDEKVVWIEQPIPSYFTPGAIGQFLFAIPWTAFSVFWICAAAGFKLPDFSKGMEAFFPLFGLPFFLIGLGMLSTPVWIYKKALKTVYVITNKRAIIFDPGWRSMTVRSYTSDQLTNVFRKDKSNGTGDVIFDGETYASSSGKFGSRTYSENIGFLRIHHSKEVEEMLRKLAQSDRSKADV